MKLKDHVVMADHNPQYVISPEGVIFDTKINEEVKIHYPCQSDYPLVYLRKVDSDQIKALRLPHLLAYYFVKNFKVNYTVERLDKSKPWTVKNIRAFHAKNRFPKTREDFHNWNNTAIYCA